MFPTKKQKEYLESIHEITWLEYEIPEDLEDELSGYIEDKINDYQKKCSCGLCKKIK